MMLRDFLCYPCIFKQSVQGKMCIVIQITKLMKFAIPVFYLFHFLIPQNLHHSLNEIPKISTLHSRDQITIKRVSRQLG